MLIERIVYSCLCAVLLVYIACKYMKTKETPYIVLLSFQIISLMVQLLSLFKGVYPNYAIQSFILVFSVIVPSTLFLLEYIKVDANEYFLIKAGDVLVSDDAVSVFSGRCDLYPCRSDADASASLCGRALCFCQKNDDPGGNFRPVPWVQSIPG